MLRFHIPLVEPGVRFSRTGLSDKDSRFRTRRHRGGSHRRSCRGVAAAQYEPGPPSDLAHPGLQAAAGPSRPASADLDAICPTLIQISQLIVDRPETVGLDTNPLFADERTEETCFCFFPLRIGPAGRAVRCGSARQV